MIHVRVVGSAFMWVTARAAGECCKPHTHWESTTSRISIIIIYYYALFTKNDMWYACEKASNLLLFYPNLDKNICFLRPLASQYIKYENAFLVRWTSLCWPFSVHQKYFISNFFNLYICLQNNPSINLKVVW